MQFDDTLSRIADLYGIWVDDLAEGNCIVDKNVITVGQVLHVPGDSQPQQPEVACVPWEVLTPFNGSQTVPSDGSAPARCLTDANPAWDSSPAFSPDGNLVASGSVDNTMRLWRVRQGDLLQQQVTGAMALQVTRR